jgi:hypothetical protein
MSNVAVKVSLAMQDIAGTIDREIARAQASDCARNFGRRRR